MDYFRQNFVVILATLVMMLFAAPDSMSKHSNNIHRAFVADEVVEVIDTERADSENSANDEGRFRRIKKRSLRVVSSNQINLDNIYSVRCAYGDIAAYLPYRSVAKPRFTTLFCQFRI